MKSIDDQLYDDIQEKDIEIDISQASDEEEINEFIEREVEAFRLALKGIADLPDGATYLIIKQEEVKRTEGQVVIRVTFGRYRGVGNF